MRIFSGLQFEKGVDYSSIQIVCERVILFQRNVDKFTG